MGVGLTSLGHLWAGRRRPHNNYVIGNPADTTPIVHSAEHYAARAAGQRPQGGPQRSCSGATIPGPAGRRPNRDCGPQGGAAEELLGNYAISARRPQTSMGELRAKCEPSAGQGGAAWYYATRHHRLRTFQGTRALVEPRELRAGASTSRRYGPRTRVEPRAVRAGGAARLRRRVTWVKP